MYKTEVEVDEQTSHKLPEPSGYRILVVMPDLEEKTEGGVYMPQDHVAAESTASIIGLVLKLGPDAYKDDAKFPTGPWCEQGEFVIFRSYSGTRFKLAGKEFRLINDDSVEAVVDDPRGYKRV